jgi:hypothetical protein
MCVFLTYESSPIKIEEKFANMASQEFEEKHLPIAYRGNLQEKYLYASRYETISTRKWFDNLNEKRLFTVLRGIPIENMELLIDCFKREYPNRVLVLFLDYVQIIDGMDKLEGWERIKRIAYLLESLAINKEIVIVTASQVNENRQTREGRDIYNAATTVLDIYNHSHDHLKITNNGKDYKSRIDGKNVCSFSAIKQKHGESFQLDSYFLFNGFFFEKNRNNQKIRREQYACTDFKTKACHQY